MSREPDPRAGGTAIERLAHKLDPDASHGGYEFGRVDLKAASMALLRLERQNIRLRDLSNAQEAAIKGLEKRLGDLRESHPGQCPRHGWFLRACPECAMSAREAVLRMAIERAIDDAESGSGWGPDVTVVGYLRGALVGQIPG